MKIILIILACVTVYFFLVIRFGQFLADQERHDNEALSHTPQTRPADVVPLCRAGNLLKQKRR